MGSIHPRKLHSYIADHISYCALPGNSSYLFCLKVWLHPLAQCLVHSRTPWIIVEPTSSFVAKFTELPPFNLGMPGAFCQCIAKCQIKRTLQRESSLPCLKPLMSQLLILL